MENERRTVFLAGPMRGIPRNEALAWRNKVKDLLGQRFHVLHALRGREEKETFTDPRGAVIRDKNDIYRSDIFIVNDTLDSASMIGTSMEVYIAHSHDIPVIVFGNAHKGDYWFDTHSHIRVDTLEEACDVVNKLFRE